MTHKPPIAVALSGGVDSAVAAALLAEEGHPVFGITMTLPEWAPPPEGEAPADAAARVCAHLGIPHHVIGLGAEFEEQVADPFCQTYRAGRTPNPCAWCNARIKFGALLDAALRLGAQALATGHYARRERRNQRWALLRGTDAHKDQSYFLSGLNQAQLAQARFPLGGQTKVVTRARAAQRGLPVARRAESQEICFVRDGAHANLVEERAGAFLEGPILSLEGKELGSHRGLPHFTIGQRRGLGIAAPEPYYVVALDPTRNAVIVGRAEAALTRTFTTGKPNWVSLEPDSVPLRAGVQVRYRQAPIGSCADPLPSGGLRVALDEPLRGVAPGQWAVFYEGAAVAASAVIESAELPGAP